MERGFIVDFSHMQVVNSVWQPGQPEPQKFLGLTTQSVKLDRQHMLTTTTFRCPECGYLESYARKENS